MRIFNEDKTQELTNYDPEKGYLLKDKIIGKILPPTQEIKEVSHFETIKLYANGGKDVVKVIDTPYKPPQPETYEYEDIYIFIPYTEEHIKNINISKLEERLIELTKDFVQDACGEYIDNIDDRRKEFIEKHNELRRIKGLLPRRLK